MKRIGIISENFDHDSKAYRVLFEKKFTKSLVQFIPLLKTMATDFQNPKRVAKLLNADLKSAKLDGVIICRDLDGIITETAKIDARQKWFEVISNEVYTSKCLFFLVISELEALILADINTFSKWCGKNMMIPFSGNPLYHQNPKAFLKEKSKGKYDESKAVEIFSLLDVSIVAKNHSGTLSFDAFLDTLTAEIIL